MRFGVVMCMACNSGDDAPDGELVLICGSVGVDDDGFLIFRHLSTEVDGEISASDAGWPVLLRGNVPSDDTPQAPPGARFELSNFMDGELIVVVEARDPNDAD